MITDIGKDDSKKRSGERMTKLSGIFEQERQWQRNLKELQEEIQKSGGLGLGKTKEEVIEALRRSRQEIFDAEYTK